MLVKYDVKIKPKLFPLKIYFFLKTLKLYHQDQTKFSLELWDVFKPV